MAFTAKPLLQQQHALVAHFKAILTGNRVVTLELGHDKSAPIDARTASGFVEYIPQCRALSCVRIDLRHVDFEAFRRILLDGVARSSTVVQLSISGGLSPLNIRHIVACFVNGPPQLRSLSLRPSTIDGVRAKDLANGLSAAPFLREFSFGGAGPAIAALHRVQGQIVASIEQHRHHAAQAAAAFSVAGGARLPLPPPTEELTPAQPCFDSSSCCCEPQAPIAPYSPVYFKPVAAPDFLPRSPSAPAARRSLTPRSASLGVGLCSPASVASAESAASLHLLRVVGSALNAARPSQHHHDHQAVEEPRAVALGPAAPPLPPARPPHAPADQPVSRAGRPLLSPVATRPRGIAAPTVAASCQNTGRNPLALQQEPSKVAIMPPAPRPLAPAPNPTICGVPQKQPPLAPRPPPPRAEAACNRTTVATNTSPDQRGLRDTSTCTSPKAMLLMPQPPPRPSVSHDAAVAIGAEVASLQTEVARIALRCGEIGSALGHLVDRLGGLHEVLLVVGG